MKSENNVGRSRISTRILLTLLIPMIGLLLVSIYIVVDKASEVRDMDRAQKLVDLSVHISAMVHELQRERGASEAFVASRGAKMADLLPNIRKENDKRIGELELYLKDFGSDAFGAQTSNQLAMATNELKQLAQKRTMIQSFSIAPADSTAYFSGTIGKWLDIIAFGAKTIQNSEFTNGINAYFYLLQAKERSGQERAAGARGYFAGGFEPAVYRRYTSVVSEQMTYFRLFDQYALPSQKEALAQLFRQETAIELERLRNIVLEAGAGGDLKGIDGNYWFKTSSGRIDLIKEFEDGLSAELVTLAGRISDEAHVGLLLSIVISGGILAIAGLLGMRMAQSISAPVIRMTDAMTKLSNGNLTIDVPAQDRTDEIGAMAEAVNFFKQSLIKNDAMAAEQVRIKAKAEADRLAAEEELDREVGSVVAAAAAGDLGPRVHIGNKSGFLKRLGENLNNLLDNISIVVRELDRVQGALSTGDLNQQVTGAYHGVFAQLKDATNGFVDILQGTISGIISAADDINNSASEVSQAAGDLSERNQQQASQLEESNASIQQLGNAVVGVGRAMTDAQNLAKEAEKETKIGASVANSAVEAVMRIEKSSKSISNFVDIIDEIAFQTNLLALNAAVEAARAGDAGKGFAVVAQEVRSLASRSAAAAREIDQIVQSSLAEIGVGVEKIRETGNALGNISGKVAVLTQKVTEVSQAAHHQALDVKEISKAMDYLDDLTQRNAALSEESSSAARSMAAKVSEMLDLVNFFDISQRRPKPKLLSGTVSRR